MAEMNLRNLPPGVRFCPNDIELIRYVEGKNHGCNDFIPVYDISQTFKPDQLPQNCSTRGKKGELYCYVERDPNKSRQKRSVDGFSWVNTNPSMITDQGTVKGQKTSLVLYSGRGRKGTKTGWMMQEYSLIAATSPEGSSNSAKDKKMKKRVVGKYVLCKIYKKATTECETEEVSFNSIEDELVDEDRNDRINAYWSDIHEHADDANILSWILG